MRIAVLVYGRLNKSAETHENIMANLGIRKCDQVDFFASSDNSSEESLANFISLYSPIAYDNSEKTYTYDLGIYPCKRVEVNLHNMACHFINKNRVFSLLDEHIQNTNTAYDLVVSLRIDILFDGPLITSHPIAENTIYIPEGSDFICDSINDQLAYGSVDVMRKYNSIDPVYLLDNGLSIPHPESLHYANIIRVHQLNVCRIPVGYRIIR